MAQGTSIPKLIDLKKLGIKIFFLFFVPTLALIIILSAIGYSGRCYGFYIDTDSILCSYSQYIIAQLVIYGLAALLFIGPLFISAEILAITISSIKNNKFAQQSSVPAASSPIANQIASAYKQFYALFISIAAISLIVLILSGFIELANINNAAIITTALCLVAGAANFIVAVLFDNKNKGVRGQVIFSIFISLALFYNGIINFINKG